MLATCKCAEGFVHFKNLCVDIDQCSKFTNLCGNNECINTPGSYHCRSTETFLRRTTQNESSPKFNKGRFGLKNNSGVGIGTRDHLMCIVKPTKDSRIWRLYEKRLLNGKGRCISRDHQDKNIHFEKV